MALPETPTLHSERKALCDLTVTRAAELMAEHGAPVEMIVDRMMTYALARIVVAYGEDGAIAALEWAQEGVRRGVFDRISSGGQPGDAAPQTNPRH